MSWETASSMQIVLDVASGQVVCHHLAIAAFLRILFLSISFCFLIASFLLGSRLNTNAFVISG